jgi:hypothetical protein
MIELKTAIVDLLELLGTVDRKVRLTAEIARERDWRPRFVAAAVIVSEGRTNRRRVHEHASLVRAALPSDGRSLHPWIKAPSGPIRALAFWPNLPTRLTRGGRGAAQSRG